jgi:hypothetical protein
MLGAACALVRPEPWLEASATMVRKIEVGAGVAAGVLGLVALAVVLLAPLVAACPVALDAAHQCPVATHQVSLPRAGLSGGEWAYLVALGLLPVAGAAGAVLDGELGDKRGLIALWGGAVLAFAGCALTALGVGLFFLPPVLALLIATYAAIVRRTRTGAVPAMRVWPLGGTRRGR